MTTGLKTILHTSLARVLLKVLPTAFNLINIDQYC